MRREREYKVLGRTTEDWFHHLDWWRRVLGDNRELSEILQVGPRCTDEGLQRRFTVQDEWVRRGRFGQRTEFG